MNDSPSVLHNKEEISIVSEELIEKLKSMALQVPLKRARMCLHMSHGDAVQEMVIVLHKDTYIRPHRHEGKTESFHMIEGAVLIGFFNDSGSVQKTVRLSAERKNPFLYRLSAALWHTVVPLTEFAVFHEVSTGPFSASEYPAWEPEDHLPAIQRLKEKVRNFQ
ncbi:MAG TPA: WbuC family cupin fold metalloprotein [Chlamydiales bacterium]|jgi:cupin fold WbuC family metalloprotein